MAVIVMAVLNFWYQIPIFKKIFLPFCYSSAYTLTLQGNVWNDGIVTLEISAVYRKFRCSKWPLQWACVTSKAQKSTTILKDKVGIHFSLLKEILFFCYYKERSKTLSPSERLSSSVAFNASSLWLLLEHKNIVNLVKESPGGRIEHLPCPRFSRGADVKKKQDLLEGKLKRCITGNTISLLFARALVQEQQWLWIVDLQSVCWLWFLVAAVFQKTHPKGITT